jgi:hypothetical protein
MPGATQLAEGATFAGAHTVRSNGTVETRLDTKLPDGEAFTIVLDGDASAVTKHFQPGDEVGSFLDKHQNVAIINETRHSVSFHDEGGHYHTETLERSGAVVEKHHHNSLPDDQPGARASSLILDDKHHVRLPPGKDAEAVINSVHEGDDVTVYRDAHNQPVIYNETQRTVSRRDAHGHYTTEPQQEQSVKAELTKITRDPKNPDHATLELTDDFGITQNVEVQDKPGRRIEALMKPGDAVEATYKDVSPGKSDLSVKDVTRSVSYDVDHNGGIAVVTHPRSQAAQVQGVTHQHGDGPTLQTAPGTPFSGKVETVKDDHGVVEVSYNDAMGKPHTVAIDSHPGAGPKGLGSAALDTLQPGDGFRLQFKNDGSYELTDYTKNKVVTPGRGDDVNVAPLTPPPQTPVKSVGGRD